MAKNRLILSCLAISLFVLLSLTNVSLPAYATTYYVDATNGNDFNDGLSPESAWKTISKVNSMDFKPGDTILFKRGEIWREQLIVPSSGTEGNPITFGAYGEGEKPKITGADIVTNWIGPNEYGVWKISGNSRHYRILLEDGQKLQKISPTDGSDLNPGQWGGDDSNYIYYKPSSGTPDDHIVELGARKHSLYINGKSYIKVENLRFEVGNAYERPYDPDPLYLRSVVVLENSHSCEISNCEVLYGGYLGISLNGCTNCTIKSNELTYTDERAITIGADCSDITVSFNHIHHIGKKAGIINGNNPQDKEGIAVSSYGSGGFQEPFNIKVEHNVIHDIGCEFLDRSTRAKGIVVCSGGADSGNITDIIIRYNKIFNCDGRGISLEGVDGDYEVYYNIIFNNGIGNRQSSHPWGGLIIFTRTGTTSNVEIFNNVIWKNDGAGPGPTANVRVDVASDSTLTFSFKNNIIGLFQNPGGYDLRYLPSGTLNLESDHNLFYEDSGNKNCINWWGKVYDFAHVLGNQSGYYSYNKSQDSNSITQDPLFIDPDNNNFHLQSNSLCINKGTDVGLTEDMEGNPVDYAPDIGAYEYSELNYTEIHVYSQPSSNPTPEILANGSDSPITLRQLDTLTLTISLKNNGVIDNADWWLAKDTPSGLYFFTFEGWTTDWVPGYQGPLFNLDSFEVLNVPASEFPVGTYTFYFCIDTNMDNNITWDSLYCDSIVVNVTE